jgi:transcriptional regulator with XRE-family HTH domain
MRKIGLFLQEERNKKKLTLAQMERETKIKKQFIDLIEKGDWENLPEYPITSGFVKTIAKSLGIPEETAIAILRRDYPFDKKKVSINPKPDLKLKVSINPKILVAVLSVLMILFFLGYLFYQYIQYVSPPKLIIDRPAENQEVIVGNVVVAGKTDSDVTLTVNNQRVLVSETGEFSDKIEVDEQTKDIVFVAKSRYGKETVVIRKIIPKLK